MFKHLTSTDNIIKARGLVREVFRYTLGIIFMIYGLDYFDPWFQFDEGPRVAASYVNTMMGNSIIMNIVESIELIGGYMLLSKRHEATAVVFLFPVAVSIMIISMLVLSASRPLALIMLIMNFYLLIVNKDKYIRYLIFDV